ncbi:MAG: PTS sugar transporter subunit IIA [Anaerocolumna sp.]
MIADMLKLKNIRIVEEINDWKEAIHLSLEPLVEGGFVTDNYEKAIIESTKEYGPYYVLAEDFALIHGRPTDGVIEKQLSITLLRRPVKFADDSYPVRVLIALAASDSNSHVDTMRVLSTIFMDEDKINELVQAVDSKQIYDLLITAESNLQE